MSEVNPKKGLVFQNSTTHFDKDKDRVKVRVSSPRSYKSRQDKIEGFESRLYWQFRFCQDHNGQTFYYTLTYNDRNIPRHYGMNCFDYEDLRDLLTGSFRKILLRKYGTKFKYFVSAELGDGKGERGLHNNPHYHVLFFLEDACDKRFPYKVISSEDFRHLVRLAWQGVDQDDFGFFDYKLMKYGVAKEGEDCGKVKDFRACSYVAKYVCKDVAFVKNESKVEQQAKLRLRNELRYSEDIYGGFYRDFIQPMYNIPLDSSGSCWKYTDSQLFDMYFPYVLEWMKAVGIDCDGKFSYQPVVSLILENEGLENRFLEYFDSRLEPFVQQAVNEWRNRFSNKCRISQGVGEYALEHIQDKLNPRIQVPDSDDGFKNRVPCMYYYRKLFCDVVKDSNGVNLYVLNALGREYKALRLPVRIKKLVSECSGYLAVIDGFLYDRMYESDVNTDVTFSYSDFRHALHFLLEDFDINTILTRYAEYKYVYQDRFFQIQDSGSDGKCSFPPIDVTADYKRFLVPSFYSVPRNDLMLSAFLESPPSNYLPYSEHSYFHRFIGIFNVLDLCSDYFFIQKDNRSQDIAERLQAIKRFHNKRLLKEYYQSLNI